MVDTSQDGSIISDLTPSRGDDDLPHPVDRHVGLHIRMRRKSLGMSQEVLAEAIGVTFQQVQKYERGANRVSASRLWEIAQALGTPVSDFYDGLDSALGDDPQGFMHAEVQAFLLTADGIELAGCVTRIRRPGVRRKLLELVKVLADDEQAQRLQGLAEIVPG
jgi:transcriptional regulator with XRE-family HTH domain